MFFSFTAIRPSPKGSGHWHLWRWKLAFKAAEMAMDRQGAKRPVDWWPLTMKISQRAASSFLGYHATGNKGLEGALRATEISCVPLLENQALTMVSWVLFWLWGTHFCPCFGRLFTYYVSRYVSKIIMLTTSVEAICFNYRPKKDNTYPIMLRLTKSGKRKYVSLGVSVKEEHWDFKKNTPKRNCPDRDSVSYTHLTLPTMAVV